MKRGDRIKKIPKRQRLRLARAELLMYLADYAQEWSNALGGRDDRTVPFEEWDEDDPFRELADLYGLTGDDLAKLLDGLGQQLEDRSLRTGFDEAWR